MPTIVIAANEDMAPLEAKLAPFRNSFQFHEYYGSTSRFWEDTATPAATSIVDLISGLISNNTLTTANSKFNLLSVDSSDFEDLSQNLSAAYAVVRSVNFEYNKFAASELTSQAIRLLSDADVHKLSSSQRSLISALRVLFSLWDLYLNEHSPQQLEIALSMSSALKSELLRAQCLRLINLSAGYSEFSRHCLEEAELIFRRQNQEPMAIYW